MKTNITRTTLLLVLAVLSAAPVWQVQAATINSTYTGNGGDGLWSTAANWSPEIVPNNTPGQSFNVYVDAPDGVFQDIDVRITSLAMAADDFSLIITFDSNFISSSTNLGASNDLFGGGAILALAPDTSVVCNLGALANFSGNALNGGNYIVVTEGPDPTVTANIRFNGADVRTNNADVQFGGVGTTITDQSGRDAFRHLQRNGVNGIFYMEVGHNYTDQSSLVNEGEIDVVSEFGGLEAPTTMTINGDYTGVGYPLDAGTVGFAGVVAAGPTADAKMVIKGALTNYDPMTKTLHKSYFKWQAARGRSATTRVLGGSKPLDIVTSEAALLLFGPNTGLRDQYGNDALRNLAVSARLLMGNRNFTTNGSFTSTNRLSVFGDSRFTVNGNLTTQSGFLEVSPLSGYVRNGDDGFPDPPYLSSAVLVKGNYNLLSNGSLRFHVLDHSATATISVAGTAVFCGSLQTAVEDISRVSSSDSFTVLTAGKITGQFSNVRSGERVDVYGGFDQFGTPVGDPVGSFLVTYNKTSLVLSDFQAAP